MKAKTIEEKESGYSDEELVELKELFEQDAIQAKAAWGTPNACFLLSFKDYFRIRFQGLTFSEWRGKTYNDLFMKYLRRARKSYYEALVLVDIETFRKMCRQEY